MPGAPGASLFMQGMSWADMVSESDDSRSLVMANKCDATYDNNKSINCLGDAVREGLANAGADSTRRLDPVVEEEVALAQHAASPAVDAAPANVAAAAAADATGAAANAAEEDHAEEDGGLTMEDFQQYQNELQHLKFERVSMLRTRVENRGKAVDPAQAEAMRERRERKRQRKAEQAKEAKEQRKAVATAAADKENYLGAAGNAGEAGNTASVAIAAPSVAAVKAHNEATVAAEKAATARALERQDAAAAAAEAASVPVDGDAVPARKKATLKIRPNQARRAAAASMRAGADEFVPLAGRNGPSSDGASSVRSRAKKRARA